MRETREERFRRALMRIAAYMTPAQLRRQSQREYGLSYEEVLEMAYENVLGEAKTAIRVLRRKRPSSVLLTKSTDSADREPVRRPRGAKGSPECRAARLGVKLQ